MAIFSAILVNALYLLALINPVSKISVLSVFSPDVPVKELNRAALKSSAVAACILLGSMLFGDVILRRIFQVDLYSLRVAGGIVLFWVGFGALTKGVFFEEGTHARFSDISIVPLACPMIAGPATITASLALAIREGAAPATASMVLALGANLALMLAAKPLGALLSRFNVLGALIRITGLIVITMGVQMVLAGVSQWLAAGTP